MSPKPPEVLYLRVKSAAERVLASGEEPTVDNVYDLIGRIGDKKQVAAHLKRWKVEHREALKLAKKGDITSETLEQVVAQRTNELKKSISLVRATLESTADGILMIDNKGRLVDWNQKFIEMAKIPSEILEKGNERAGLRHMLKQVEKPWELIKTMIKLRLNPSAEGEVGEVLMKDGRIVERYSQPHRVGGKIVGRVWSFRDVTEQRRAEEALRLRERAIIASTQGIIIANDVGHSLTINYVNPAFERITGYSLDEVVGKNISFLYEKDAQQPEIQSVSLAVKEKKEDKVVLRCNRKDGSIFWNEMNLAPVPDAKGNIKHFVVIIDDITERKAMEQQLMYQATHDSLTDLPNRTLLIDRLQQAILYAKQNHNNVLVLFLDLDHFKNVNDSLGHGMGDQLLCAVAKRIHQCLPITDTVARIGGDEFLIIMQNISDIDVGIRIVNDVLEAIRKPFEIEERELNITASAGVTCYPRDSESPDTLTRNADIAMYHAKDLGRNNFQFFTEEMNRLVSHRIEMENYLRKALENEELNVVFQPIFNLESGKITSLEALLRWENSKLGKVSPIEFIPLAEETGLIVPIGEWVLKTACTQTKQWHDMGLKDLSVAVNMSGRQLQSSDLLEMISRVLSETELSPENLVLEMTESIIMDRTEETIQRLHQIREMGLMLAVDDFGTGYSSLSYLKRLPVNKLKIDKAFISDIETNKNDEAITMAIIAMCKNLNLKVVAEGMQTQRQLEFLKKYQCDEVQGYYFSKPIDAESCTRLLRENYGLLGGDTISEEDLM